MPVGNSWHITAAGRMASNIKILIEDPSATGDRAARFAETMKETMALHAKLDGIVLLKSSATPECFGCSGMISRKTRSVVMDG